MDKLAILRSITSMNPAITVEIIERWGTPELYDYVDHLLERVELPEPANMVDLILLIDALKSLHGVECPDVPCPSHPAEAAVRALPGFDLIDERFPHVGRRIIQSWGSESFYTYVGSLFTDDRGGKRQGFPREVIRAIAHIAAIHEKAHPRRPRVADVWPDVL